MNSTPDTSGIAAGKAAVSVAAFTQGLDVPSSRFRVRQLMPALTAAGVHVTEYSARKTAFPPVQTHKRPAWLLGELAARVPQLVAARKHDVSILQREMISTLPTLERLTKKPRIFDVDDAIWLYRGGLAANFIARHADVLVCGNDFIAEYFAPFKKTIAIIPTAVDVVRFSPHTGRDDGKRIIGWSGTSGGYGFFDGIEQALGQFLRAHPEWTLRIVADRPPPFTSIPAAQLEYVPWSAANEARTIAEMDIGLMPLDDSLWSRGKCSYKMLLYMACAIPVVVSDVGMNATILREAAVGLGVTRPAQWIEALERLVRDAPLRARMGDAGRALILQKYSVEMAAQRWEQVIRDVAR